MAIQTRNITDSISEIYIGGGNFITESYPTNFHTFTTRKILTAKDSIENYKEVTPKEREAMEKVDSLQKPTRTALTAIFEAAGATFNDNTGYYELNGINDIGEEEIITMYLAHLNALPGYMMCRYMYNSSRTFFPFTDTFGESITDFTETFFGCGRLERVVFFKNKGLNVNCSKTAGLFKGCVNLEYVEGTINIFDNTAYAVSHQWIFSGCKKLREVRLRGVLFDLELKDSPLISLASIKFMIENAHNKKEITFKVHSETYSYIMGTAEPIEQVGGTSEEWQALVGLAAEKQITFVTTS